MKAFREECERVVRKIVGEAELEIPPKEIGADLALPCFQLAKRMKKSPESIAKEIVRPITGEIMFSKLIKRVEVSGPYINFYANWNELCKLIIKAILKEKGNYGKGNKRGRVMVEYSSPNSNKPLHVGHLRNDSIGMAMSNILAFCGYDVIKANLINDRGIHICKSMLAYRKWGRNRKPNKKSDHFIGDFYVMFEKRKNDVLENEAQELLKNWERKDGGTIKLWKMMNSWSIDGMKQTYKMFGSEFDVFFLESQFYNKAEPIIGYGLRKGVFFENDKGAVVANLKPLPNKIVLREDGTAIYITNDLALTKYKFDKYRLDKSIWVVASEQNLYFQQLFRIFKLLGYDFTEKCYHLSYGLVNLPTGRMKTREGTVIDADDLISDVIGLAKKEITKRERLNKNDLESRARYIALAAIKYYLLKVEPIKDLLFDARKAISFEGDTGPYLQYTYARAKSILRKSRKRYSVGELKGKEIEIVKMLSLFPETIGKSAREFKPHYLANYLFELATAFNEFYHSQQVIGSDREEKLLALVSAVAITLKNGLNLLGIKALEKM